MSRPLNGTRNGNGNGAASINRKLDRLLVLATHSARRQMRILKLLEKKAAEKRRPA